MKTDGQLRDEYKCHPIVGELLDRCAWQAEMLERAKKSAEYHGDEQFLADLEKGPQ